MIRKLRVTVDGNTYDVTVELADEGAGAGLPAAAPPAPPAPPPVVPAAAPPPSAPSPPVAPAAASAPPPAAAGPGDVPSPLAGRVTAIVATPGQDVKEGDQLLTLEAMKMNTFVFAPRNGKVARINVAVGDAVEEGQALARIE